MKKENHYESHVVRYSHPLKCFHVIAYLRDHRHATLSASFSSTTLWPSLTTLHSIFRQSRKQRRPLQSAHHMLSLQSSPEPSMDHGVLDRTRPRRRIGCLNETMNRWRLSWCHPFLPGVVVASGYICRRRRSRGATQLSSASLPSP
jgi:hypothetical protein